MRSANLLVTRVVALMGMLLPLVAGEGTAYPPVIADAAVETYKTVGDARLNLWIFRDGPLEPARPAVVFFFGGGWNSGSPMQFVEQCRHLAKRGMVAMVADYRVKSRNQVKPVQCIADARSALRFVRANAARLGIDPARIASAGGSAGGHLAASTAFISAFDESSEDLAISPVPNALILFNPGLVMAPVEGLTLSGFGTGLTEQQIGGRPEQISPAHHLRADAPPTIIFHGRADTTVPYASAEAFTRLMVALGNRCELIAYDDQSHGFFNREPFKAQTLAAMDAFLVSLGWLAKP